MKTNTLLSAIITLPVPTALILTTMSFCAGGQPVEEDTASMCKSGRITVQGEAPLFTSVSAARNKAREDACRSAVEKCIGSAVSSQAGVADGQSLGEEVFDQAKGLCKKWEILDESRYQLDTITMFRVSIRYSVEPSALDQTINTLQNMVGNPRSMVLIRETVLEDGRKVERSGYLERGKAAAMLQDYLTSKGYTVVDAGRVFRGMDVKGELSEDLKDIAASRGIDAIIMGEIELSPQRKDMIGRDDMFSYRATGNLTVQTLWGRGKLIGNYSESMPGAGFSRPAAMDASLKRFVMGGRKNETGGLAKYLHERVSSEWSTITRNNQIYMKISGLEKRGSAFFHDDLIERTAVKHVNEIQFTPGEIEWEVIYPGRAYALADTIEFYKDNPKMFLALRETGKKIRVSLVKRGEIHLSFE